MYVCPDVCMYSKKKVYIYILITVYTYTHGIYVHYVVRNKNQNILVTGISLQWHQGQCIPAIWRGNQVSSKWNTYICILKWGELHQLPLKNIFHITWIRCSMKSSILRSSILWSSDSSKKKISQTCRNDCDSYKTSMSRPYFGSRPPGQKKAHTLYWN